MSSRYLIVGDVEQFVNYATAQGYLVVAYVRAAPTILGASSHFAIHFNDIGELFVDVSPAPEDPTGFAIHFNNNPHPFVILSGVGQAKAYLRPSDS